MGLAARLLHFIPVRSIAGRLTEPASTGCGKIQLSPADVPRRQGPGLGTRLQVPRLCEQPVCPRFLELRAIGILSMRQWKTGLAPNCPPLPQNQCMWTEPAQRKGKSLCLLLSQRPAVPHSDTGFWGLLPPLVLSLGKEPA